MSLRQVRKPHMKKIEVTTTIAMRLVRIGAGPVAGFDVAYSMARSVCVARRWPRGRALKTASASVVQRCHRADGAWSPGAGRWEKRRGGKEWVVTLRHRGSPTT